MQGSFYCSVFLVAEGTLVVDFFEIRQQLARVGIVAPDVIPKLSQRIVGDKQYNHEDRHQENRLNGGLAQCLEHGAIVQGRMRFKVVEKAPQRNYPHPTRGVQDVAPRAVKLRLLHELSISIGPLFRRGHPFEPLSKVD